MGGKNGFLLIDKPKTWTSFDVCAKLKKILDTKKIGHTGTLDPFATGLLLIAVGKCTRFIPWFEQAKKSYETTIFLGKTTETLDTESETIDCNFAGKIPDLETVEKVISENFLGKISQIPPKFSALKINGKRSYDLARQGIEFEIKSRATEIFSCEILDYDFPKLSLKIEVSAGFYVRSLARDLGGKLANGGYCLELKRTAIGNLDLEKSAKMDNDLKLIDPREILDLPVLNLPAERLDDFSHGRAMKFSRENFPDYFQQEKEVLNDNFIMIYDDESIGLGIVKDDMLQPKIVF